MSEPLGTYACPICEVETPHWHTPEEQRDARVFDTRNYRAGAYGAQIGDANRKAVFEYLASHIGATKRECAKALGLSPEAVGRHVKVIRQEWLSNQEARHAS